MATLNVRRLDEDVVAKLKRRAAENNRSLEGEARHVLEKSVEDDMPERMRAFRAKARKLRELTRGTKQTPSEILIRKDRDRGHKPWMDY